MSPLLPALLEDESGQDMADYAVLIGLIVIGVVICTMLIRFLVAEDKAGRSFPSNRRVPD